MAATGLKEPGWIKPFLPELDAAGTDFHDNTPSSKPRDFDLDRLFYSEHLQLINFGGLRTFESLVLQELEPYTPRPGLSKGLSGYDSSDSSEDEEDEGENEANKDYAAPPEDDDEYSIDDEKGGAPLFDITTPLIIPPAPWVERDFVEVDESKWFKIFQRERWASYYNDDPGQLSVDIDNGEHWGKLKRVIEIANRILSEALSQEWIASFLDPAARDARGPVTSGHGSNSWSKTTIYRVVPVPPQSRLSNQEARNALDDIAQDFFWGFHMPDEYPGANGKTSHIRSKDGRTLHWMTLLLSSMEPVFKEKTPEDPEGRQAAVGMAKTMLHELAHALSRHFHDLIPKSKSTPCCTGELFFDEERWAEAGYSFENAVFGTAVKNHWVPITGRIQYLGIRGMSPRTCESSLHWKYDNWSIDDPFLDTPLGIPGILPCAMTTSDFWTRHVAKYGCSSLRMSWVCEGKSETRYGRVQAWPTKVMDQPYKYSGYKELNGSMEAVAQKLRNRRLKLKRLRPWYADEYARWCTTVYAETSLRVTMMSMAITLYGRSIKHEADAKTCIDKMLKPHGRLADLEEAIPENERASLMFYQALGFLGQAALPVRQSPISYTDDSVGEYPDRIRPGLRPSFAGDQDLVEKLFQYGKMIQQWKKTKTLYRDGIPSHDRELCMSNARIAFLRWKLLGNATDSLMREFELEWQSMRRKLDQVPLDDVFLDWSHGTWRFLRAYGGEADHHAPLSFHGGNEVGQHREGVDTDIPAWAIARPARPATTSASMPAEAGFRRRYFTAGEIGDRQRLDSPVRWAGLWNGQDIEIHDITRMLPNGTWNFDARAHFTLPSPASICRMLRLDRIGEAWLDELRKRGPLGYAMIPRREEDVRINDGKLGRPLWVEFAGAVFDVTDIELEPELHELEAVFSRNGEGDPVVEAVNRGYHPDLIQKALRPYKIGSIRSEVHGNTLRHRVFTVNEVKWHTTRETGIYTIIHNNVYDFTSFIDYHPGGVEILKQVAGRDATALWDKYHHEPISCYNTDVHRQLSSLQVGRIVKERDNKSVSSTEIRIRDFIFSLDKIPTNDKSLDSLASLWGTDGTAEMEKQVVLQAYHRLWERPDLIIAKVVTPRDKLPFMSQQVLEGMNGKEMPWGFNETYVSDGMYVYNLTSLLRYTEPTPLLEALKAQAGSVIASNTAGGDEMKQWLSSINQHRIIALYRAPKHNRSSAEIQVAWKTAGRRKPNTSPKVTAKASSSAVATSQTSAQGVQKPAMGAPAPTPTPLTVRPLHPLKKQKRDDVPGSSYLNLSHVAQSDSGKDHPKEAHEANAKILAEQMELLAHHGAGRGEQKRKRSH